jgi:hypothetical protein
VYVHIVLGVICVCLHYQVINLLVTIYHGKNKLYFNEMMVMMATLYETKMLSWIFIVLVH